ncbi:MAG: transglutaminase-like domain-containing protein [Desulfobacteraceae bacterium]
MNKADNLYRKARAPVLLPACFFLAWLSSCAALSVDIPIQSRLDQVLGMDTTVAEGLEERWFALYHENKKIGWRHVRESRLRWNGRSFQLHTQTTYEKYFRYGQAVEKKEIVKTVHNTRNQLVCAAVSIQGGNQTPSLIKVRDCGGRLEVTLMRGDTKKTDILNCQVPNLFPLSKQIQTMELTEDFEKQIRLFDPDRLSVDTYTARVISRAKLDLGDFHQTAWLVNAQNRKKDVLAIYTSAESPSRVLKIEYLDKPRSFVRTTRGKAGSGLEHYDFNQTHDIKEDAPISSNWRVHTAVLDISNEALNRVLVEDSWQTRLEESGRVSTRWIFRARDVNDRLADVLPLSLYGAAPYLGVTFYIQSDHPKIRKTAALIKGDETNALRLFRKIAMWVFNNIKDKNYKTALATAVETLERRQGDCTEHSVLTVALARAIGIPARIATGLYYTGESFTYHMWVEALVAEDLWVAVDPSMGQIEPDALHLTVYQGDFDIGTHTNVTWGLVQSLNSGDLKIISINRNFTE